MPAVLASDARRQRAFRRTREEILDAAASTFARKGFRGTTVNAIAAAAGYTAPTLYAYFGSKSDIFAALNELVLEEIARTYEEDPLPGLGFEQRLHLLVRSQLQIAAGRRDAFAVFFAVRPLEEPGLNGKSGFEICVERLAGWIRDASTPQQRGGWDAEDLAWALAGMIHASIRRSLRKRAGSEPPREAAAIVELLLRGMRGESPAARTEGNGTKQRSRRTTGGRERTRP